MSNASWWADKLGQSRPAAPAPQPQQQPYVAPTSAPMPGHQPYMPVNPNMGQQMAPSKAQSAMQTQPCPECFGNNYMSVLNAAPRCYDCGYPLVQAGSGMGSLQGARVEGAVQAANGNNATNNYNPQTIIGHI